MTPIEKRLIESLGIMMSWARDLPDEILDGNPENRQFLIDDLAEARAAIAAAREAK